MTDIEQHQHQSFCSRCLMCCKTLPFDAPRRRHTNSSNPSQLEAPSIHCRQQQQYQQHPHHGCLLFCNEKCSFFAFSIASSWTDSVQAIAWSVDGDTGEDMELSLSLQGIPRDPPLFATLLSIPHFRCLYTFFIPARMLCRARRGNIPKK
jgi:hypothetical protein